MNTIHRLAIIILACAASAKAASLKQAEFTRVINDVRLLPAPQQALPAKVGDKITGTTAVSTGVASRAELRFPDKTLTRIGSNSVFKLDQADRTVNLEQGVILLQVPKQIGGAKVRTAAVTAAVTGTSCIVERTPDGFIKIIVLEGVVDVYFNNDPSNLITLVAGDILIFREDAKRVPAAGQGGPRAAEEDIKADGSHGVRSAHQPKAARRTPLMSRTSSKTMENFSRPPLKSSDAAHKSRSRTKPGGRFLGRSSSRTATWAGKTRATTTVIQMEAPADPEREAMLARERPADPVEPQTQVVSLLRQPRRPPSQYSILER